MFKISSFRIKKKDAITPRCHTTDVILRVPVNTKLLFKSKYCTDYTVWWEDNLLLPLMDSAIVLAVRSVLPNLWYT